MKKTWLLVLLISVGLNIGLGVRLFRAPAPITAKPGWSRSKGGPRWDHSAPGDTTILKQFMGRRLGYLADRLQLRPEQAEHFRQEQQTTYRLMRDLRRSTVEARDQLHELLAAAEIDPAAVRRAQTELGRRQAEADSLAAEMVLRELEVLDPGQRRAYLDFLPEGPGRRPGRGHFGR